MAKKYLHSAVEITVETPDGNINVFVRAKAATALIPGVGKVDLPEYLEEQAKICKDLVNAKKSKKPGTVSDLLKKFTAGDLLAGYGLQGSDNTLFDIRTSADDFTIDSVEEATEGMADLEKKIEELETVNADLTAENEALKSAVAELETRIAAPKPADKEGKA